MKNKLTIEDVLYMQDKVVEWNKIFGIYPDDESAVTLYQQLSNEEFFGKGEFLKSWEKQDHEGIMDGIGDLIFTVFQWGVLSGYPLGKPDGWLVQQRNPLEVNVIGLKKCLSRGQVTTSQTFLVGLLESLQAQYNILGIFERICESNYSKAICETKSIDFTEEVATIVEQGRYSDITYEKSQGYYVFKAGKDLESGVTFDKLKIVKSSHFVSVEDLGGLSEFKF